MPSFDIDVPDPDLTVEAEWEGDYYEEVTTSLHGVVKLCGHELYRVDLFEEFGRMSQYSLDGYVKDETAKRFAARLKEVMGG